MSDPYDIPQNYFDALLRYTGQFYENAIAHGMKAGPAANAVAHVERAARNLLRLAEANPSPTADQARDVNVLDSISSDLYQAVNEMMCHLGADGDIDTWHPAVNRVMDVLHDIDGGTFHDNRAAADQTRDILNEVAASFVATRHRQTQSYCKGYSAALEHINAAILAAREVE